MGQIEVRTLKHFRQCARPVIFETRVHSAPYAVSGTSFLLTFRGRLFAVTARHVVGSHPVEGILIFPSDESRQPLRILQWWQLPNDTQDRDRADLFLVEVDPRAMKHKDRKASHAFEIDILPTDWYAPRFNSQFFVFGYPKSHNEVDYEALSISTKQFLLTGKYLRATSSSDCHEIAVTNPLGLETFNGLSGSPVWSLPAAIGVRMAPILWRRYTRNGPIRNSSLRLLPRCAINARRGIDRLATNEVSSTAFTIRCLGAEESCEVELDQDNRFWIAASTGSCRVTLVQLTGDNTFHVVQGIAGVV